MGKKIQTIIIGLMLLVGSLSLTAAIVKMTIDIFKGDWYVGVLMWGGVFFLLAPYYVEKYILKKCVDCDTYKKQMKEIKDRHGKV